MTHPNIVPLLGITITPFQLISNWMSGGDLPDYIEKNPDADRLVLVRVPPVVLITHLPPVASYPTSLRASATSTPAMSFTETSRGYVVVLDLILPPH